MQVQDLDTPALLVDLDILEENTARMRSIAQKAGVALRPHYKSHHCPGLARMQMAYAKGFTCAKVGEAEDLAAAGVGDILIANQITRPEKLRRLCRLAGKTSVTVCVDDGGNVRELERFAAEDGVRLSVLVEFEIGMGRCGVERFDEVLCLAREISRQPHLHFRGIQAYAGHLAHERDREKRFAASEQIERRLAALREFLAGEGCPPEEISGLSTGTLPLREKMPTVYTEAQPGSYLFMDAAYSALSDLPFQNSLFILGTVISVRGENIHTDVGTKSCGMDQGPPVLADRPEISSVMSEEHVSHRIPGHSYRRNDLVRYIPGHCCTTLNSYDRLWLVRGGQVTGSLPIESRGKSQ